MKLEEVLEKELKDECLANKEDYIQEIANYFAYIILTKEKLETVHSFDPPWDCSGRIVSSGEKFNLNDYQSFEEFIDNEYNGESHASYTSGCGLYHSTYEESFDQKTIEWIYKQFYPIVSKLIEEENSLLKEWVESHEEDITFDIAQIDEIMDIVFFEDLIGDFIFDFSWEIKDYVLNTNPIILFNRGLEGAKSKVEKEEKEREQKLEKDKINREKAKKLWKVISNMYELKFGEKLVNKINKPLYDDKLKDILVQCYKNGTDLKEIHNIGNYLSFKFSNSVASLISNFK